MFDWKEITDRGELTETIGSSCGARLWQCRPPFFEGGRLLRQWREELPYHAAYAVERFGRFMDLADVELGSVCEFAGIHVDASDVLDFLVLGTLVGKRRIDDMRAFDAPCASEIDDRGQMVCSYNEMFSNGMIFRATAVVSPRGEIDLRAMRRICFCKPNSALPDRWGGL